MNLTIEQTLSVLAGDTNNITSYDLQRNVDWFSVVDTGSISRPDTAKTVIYFAVYDTDLSVKGWYDEPIDKRLNIQRLFQ